MACLEHGIHSGYIFGIYMVIFCLLSLDIYTLHSLYKVYAQRCIHIEKNTWVQSITLALLVLHGVFQL